MGDLRFTVVGEPIAWQRARARRGGGYHNTARHELGRRRVAAACSRWAGEIAAGDPVEVAIDYIYPRPRRLRRRADPMARLPKPTRPDRDNLDKLVLDGLQLGGLLHDDGQVWSGVSRKWYAAIISRRPALTEVSRTVIRVRWGLAAVAADELAAVDAVASMFDGRGGT